MVRAILDGRKTQTRRVVKLNAWKDEGDCDYTGQCIKVGEYIDLRLCPYGQPGDRMWVRETWAVPTECDSFSSGMLNRNVPMWYAADGEKRFITNAGNGPGKARPSIHMPRWASRITLEITGVRVERLQAITWRNAIAEGIEPGTMGSAGWKDYEAKDSEGAWSDPIDSYRTLWASINGRDNPGSWAANPWVWVVEFRRVDA